MQDKTPLVIAGTYVVVGFLWILFSDQLVLFFAGSPEQFARMQTYKGSFYVVVTAVLVWVMIQNYSRQQHAEQQRLAESIQHQKELVRELHHRIKNNLQFILSLINLSAAGVADEQSSRVFERITDRIYRMARIHAQLLEEESGTTTRLDTVVAAVQESVKPGEGNRSLVFTIEQPWTLPVDDALPLMLILGELVDNALRFGGGFAHVTGGREPDSGNLILTVQDRGSGTLPRGQEGVFSGMVLVETLAAQIQAEVSYESSSEGADGEAEDGLRVTIHLPSAAAPPVR